MLYSRSALKISLILVVCTAFALIVAAGFLPCIRARRLLAKAESLQIGKASLSDAQQLPENLEGTPTRACSPAECELIFGTGNFSGNFALPQEWRGQGEAFAVRIHVKNGLVDRKDLTYWIGAGSTISAVWVSETLDWPGNPKEPRWSKIEGTQGAHYLVHVRMTPSDSTEIRKKYTSFNWNCFWKYQGCQDEHELMPTGEW